MTQRQFMMGSEIKPLHLLYYIGTAVLLALIWHLFSNIGAGVLGKIEKYHVDSSFQELTNCINEVNSRNEWEQCDNYTYHVEESGTEGDFVFLRMETDKEKYIFMLKLHRSGLSGVDCVLISAARYCSILKNASKMTILERYRFRTIFEDEFFARCPRSWKTT